MCIGIHIPCYRDGIKQIMTGAWFPPSRHFSHCHYGALCVEF